jgi:hypothetical protein
MTDASIALYGRNNLFRTWHCVLYAIGDARNTEKPTGQGNQGAWSTDTSCWTDRMTSYAA